jgi:hypothetical protein
LIIAPQLHFEHITRTSEIPRDVRKNRAATLEWDHFYFVGFRIDSLYGERYHHALILADEHNAFLRGVAAENLKLLDYDWIRSGKDISLIFVQNFMMLNPSLAGKSVQARPKPNGQGLSVPRRNGNAFFVMGITDTYKFCQMEVDSENAIKAIDEANAQLYYEYEARFKPLLITQINTVAADFFNLLNTVLESVKELMGGAASDRGYLH